MAIAMPAYQQESASPIDAWIAERNRFRRNNRYAKIQDSVYKLFEVLKAFEFYYRLGVYFIRAARAHKTDRLLCCTQSENHDEHHGLDWHTRYKTIQGTCEGLACLHRQLEPRIYHLDLKPANILLGVSGEIKKMEDNMESLKCFLSDAERRSITEERVQRWVRKLKDAMYEATDIIDLCQLEADKRKESKGGSCKEKVPGCFQPLLFCLQNPVFAHKIGSQIKELNQRLDDIHKQADNFKFDINLGSNPELWMRTHAQHSSQRMTSEFVESAIVREKIEQEKRELVQLLITSGNHDVNVVSVWGIGGIGKTTLAKNVFNTVQEHFKVKIWLSITQQKWCHDGVVRWAKYAFTRNRRAKIRQDSGICCPRRRNKSFVHTMKLSRRRYISNLKSHKFKVTTSAKGGVYINFGSHTIYVPESMSVHHPFIQMVLFANHLHENVFSCPKSMAPKSITDMVEWSPSSASRNVFSPFPIWYEAGWVPAEHNRGLSQFARAFGIIPVETVHRSSHNSLPVLFEKSTKKVTSSNVSSTQGAGRDISVVDSGDCMSDAAEMKTLTTTCFTSSNMDNAPTGADLVDLANSSGTSMLPSAASLHQQLALNNLADERNDKPRSNSAPSDTSSDQTARVAKKHKLTDDESPNNSDPNSCVAERDTNEEAKRSGKWYVASGAAQHATGDRGVITNLQELENNDLCVHAADGMPMPVRGIGNVVTDTVVLPDVYYVPGLWTNLVSVGQLAGLDYCVGFGRGSCVVNDPAGTVVGRAHAGGDGLYEVEFLRVPFAMP